MSDSSAGQPSSASSRRKSFVEMLNPKAFGTGSSVSTSPSNAIPSAPGPAGATQRKTSMSMALGLSNAGVGQESPYNAFARQRRASISTSSAASGSPEFRNSFDENAVIEDDDKLPAMNSPPSPSFARRLSFGAQAMRDMRQTGTSPTNNAGRRPSSYLLSTLNEDSDTSHNQQPASARSSGTAKTGGEGFNWSDAMKNKRASISSGNPFISGHNRSKSFNAPVPQQPPQEITTNVPAPAPAPLRSKKPDHLGERMLRGDFMMD